MVHLTFRDLAAIQIAGALTRSGSTLSHHEIAERAFEVAAALEEQRHHWLELDADSGEELPLRKSEQRIQEIRRRRTEGDA